MLHCLHMRMRKRVTCFRCHQSTHLPHMLSCLHEMRCVHSPLQVPCEIATFEDLLGTCHKDRRLLPDLRYLQLLLAKPSQLRKEISKLINMRLTRPISPHVDSELEYHPITLALFQVSCGPFAAIVSCQDLLLDCHYMLLAVMLWVC